ncbi:MAG: ABC transporter permease [Vicinamibacterales bacterium]
MLSSLRQDLRHTWRSLRQQPVFAAVAIGSLALGIGLNTAVFSVVNGLLLRPLPVERPADLAAVFTRGGGEPYGTTSYPDFRDLAARATAFDALVGRSMMFASISVDGENRLTMGEVVTANYFDVLGIRPAIGRGFSPEEDAGELTHPVAVISDRMWRESFGGRPDVLGRTFRLKTRPYTVVGVAPRDFAGLVPGLEMDLWIPISMTGDIEPVGLNNVMPSDGNTRLERRGTRWMFVIGRLKPSVSVEAAAANVDAVMTQLAAEHPRSNADHGGAVLPASAIRVHPEIDGVLRPTGAVLLGAVGLVLLVACANLASMLLARGVSRTREMALRSALGASRTRLVRQLTVESLVLALTGGAVGLALAGWTVRALAAFRLPVELPVTFALAIDGRVVAFGLALSILTGLGVGLVPAWRASRPDLVPALKAEATGVSRRRRVSLSQALVVIQVAVSLLLVVGGLLLGRSLLAAGRVDPGWDPRGLAVASISLDFHGYTEAQGRVFYDRALEGLRQLPGVTSVAISGRLPLSPNVQTTALVVDGRPDLTPDGGVSIDNASVSEGYFETMGLPIVDGRAFDSRDRTTEVAPVVVSQALVDRFWPGERAIGRRLRSRTQQGTPFEVIGVVADHKFRTMGEAPRPIAYMDRDRGYSPYASFIIRMRGDANQAGVALTRELRALEPDLVFLESGPAARLVDLSLFPVRAGAALIGGLGALALLLAGLGLYGVIAFSVSRRTREIGIRMALGADRRRVLGQVLGEGLWLFGLGAVVGLGLAAVTTSVLGSVLLGVTPLDPASYGAAVVVLLAASLAACAVPARRAASVDPLVALRQT